MRTHAAVLAAAVLCLPLAACSSDSADAKPGKTATTNSPKSTKPSPTQPAGPMAIGDAWEWKGTNSEGETSAGATTVLSYTQPIPGIEPPGEGLGLEKGSVWAQVEVKVCLRRGASITASQFPWSLKFADGSRAEVTGLNGGDFPKPEFPTNDTVIKVGDCLRGKIPIPVPKGKRPEAIVYTPAASDEPLEWTVPAK